MGVGFRIQGVRVRVLPHLGGAWNLLAVTGAAILKANCGLRCRYRLEVQEDLVSRSITPINQIVTLSIPFISLLN